MRFHKVAAWCGVVLMAAAMCGCNKLRARDQLNKGVGAYRNAQFQQAIKHFQTAIDLDPSLLMARLYLATAYFQLYVPSGDSPENLKIADQTIDAFNDVLKYDPENVNAISSIATVYYYQKKFDKAKELQMRRLKIKEDENNPEVYYWIGQLDWDVAYPRRMQLRKDLNIANPIDSRKPDIFPPIPAKDREKLAEDNGPLVDEGINMLQKAVDLKPDYVEAISYLNLMYREKSDLEPDESSRMADIAKANELSVKATDLMKAQTQKAAEGVK